MNILIVSQYFWPETFRINDLAQGLVERGHHVTILTGKPNYPEGRFFSGYRFLNKTKEKLGEINIIRAPIIPRGKNKWQLALNYLSFAFFASIVGLFTCRKQDVIFVYEPSPITVCLPAIFLKKIRKSPILFWVQDLWPESVVAVGATTSTKILRWIDRLVRFIYQRCDYILTTSMAYFDSIKRYNIPDARLRYFPQTAEDVYQPMAASQALIENNQLPPGFRIIFSGNIGKAQDIETIIQAAAILKDHHDIQWIFLGDGSMRHFLLDEVKRLGLAKTVHWLGQFPVEYMPRFFACADALLVTLKKDPVFTLTIPAKIQSYLACAKPILAALDGEGKRIIEEAGAGFAAESGDPVKLAENVLQLYQMNEDKRQQMGSYGREYFDRHFKRDVLFQHLEQWMVELMEQNKK